MTSRNAGMKSENSTVPVAARQAPVKRDRIPIHLNFQG